AIVLFCGMHLGFAATMQLGLFSYIMCVAWLALLPSAVWDWLDQRVHVRGESCRLTVPSGLSGKMADLVETFLILPGLKIEIDSACETWHFQAEDEHSRRGWDAWAALVARSRVSIVDWLFTNRVLEAVATWVGRRGGRLGGLLNRGLRRRPLRRYPTVIGSVFVVLALGTTLAWNLHTVNNGWSMPKSWRTAAEYVRIDQKWGMFAPYPLKVDGWYVLSGSLKNGKTVPLFFDETSVRDPTDKPGDVSSMYPTQRWRKYLMNVRRSEFSEQRPHFAKWLCERWNTRHDSTRRLSSVDMYFIEEKTPPPYREPEPETVRLRKHRCLRETSNEELLKTEERVDADRSEASPVD
ncbi:MAG: hypothetical protein ABEL04_00705, partial [Salinibacter sp.]|uniref:hypothetical protein n=1 Tax=Salinibacter sp. TaxID=2065818 RepID=UPI0035D445BA